MAAVKMLDDPDHINTFLSMIDASLITPEGERAAKNDEHKRPHDCHEEVCMWININLEHSLRLL